MQPITNFLINTTRKAVKLLQRDFFELEMLQSSGQKNSISLFCNKSYLRTKEILKEELQKHTANLFFAGEEFNPLIDHDTAILVEPIDSLTNFSRSLPFFALVITYFKKVNHTFTPTHCIINFPALYEIYYAEKGSGAWLQKSSFNEKAIRLRVANCRDIENAVIAADAIDNNVKLFKEIRNFGCHSYACALLATSKVDAIFLSSVDVTLSHCFNTMIIESGGTISENMNNRFIASNYQIADKIKSKLTS